MSAYRDYIRDFPKRCIRLLDFELDAKKRELEVTLLLAIAVQAIVMPLERLEILNERLEHPSGDAEKFRLARNKLRELLNETCRRSPFFYGANGQFDASAWTFKQCDQDGVMSNHIRPLGSIENEFCDTIFRVLRNAFAHGNLQTRSDPETAGNPIVGLVFVSLIDPSKPHYGYWRLECAPATFRRFLKSWVRHLGELELMPQEIAEPATYPTKLLRECEQA